MRRALFRFDVGPGFGEGHMSRCLALAETLEQRGWDVTYAISNTSQPYMDEKYAPSTLVLDKGSIPSQHVVGYDLAIIDHYGLDSSYENMMRNYAQRIVVIDDLANRDHDCDWLIDSAPGQSLIRYKERLSANCVTLLGVDYALLKQAFIEARSQTTNQGTREKQLRLLISMGAIDSRNVTFLVLRAVAQIQQLGQVTIAIGPAAPNLADLKSQVAKLDFNAELIVGTKDMPGLILEHDIAVGAPGVSALERACLALPQLLIETAANQEMVARGLNALGCARVIGRANDLDAELIRNEVTNLIVDTPGRQKLSEVARATIDGFGARRISAHLSVDPRTRDGGQLVARKIQRSDSQILLQWQMHPSTRQYFRDPTPPLPLDHKSFMESRISQPNAFSEVISSEGHPVALVRADPKDNGYEVSIVVDPQMRGKGIGKASLSYLNSLLGPVPLTAIVAEENKPSLALFSSAGYGKRTDRTLCIQSAR